jgi:hypothetical protein
MRNCCLQAQEDEHRAQCWSFQIARGYHEGRKERVQDSLESVSLQKESSSGGIEDWKSSEEGRGSKSPRGVKLRRVDAELFGKEPSIISKDGRDPWREEELLAVGR